MHLWWKIIPFIVLLYWSYVLVSQPVPWIFLDFANLIFHEAGHVLFIPFGEFMTVLGGSLLQCLIPLAIGIYFLRSGQLYSSVFCLFWLGNNLINVSVYIKDARSRILPLLGGDMSGHDWHWLLSRVDMLNSDQQLAGFVWFFGLCCLLAALCGYVYLLSKEYYSSLENSQQTVD
jgi:hypothetical protein